MTAHSESGAKAPAARESHAAVVCSSTTLPCSARLRVVYSVAWPALCVLSETLTLTTAAVRQNLMDPRPVGAAHDTDVPIS